MSILKTSVAALALVAGFATLADAAPRHRQSAAGAAYVQQPYGTLPYQEYEGPRGAGGFDANTRAAEAFQDHFRNTY